MDRRMSMMILLASYLLMKNVAAQTYEIPPSARAGTGVPYISDAAMEQCVRLYNEANWLEDEINVFQVDNYSKKSVESYNSKVNKHSQMIDGFNQGCAGKQSESAYKAARKLNNQ